MRELIDSYGRKVRKLRVSLTDKCNMRCHYCMPVNAKFMKEDNYLSIEEYIEILSELKEFGVEEIRLTGGEPLLRREFSDFVNKLGPMEFKKIGLTTNGIFLDKYYDLLYRNNVRHINISLDSLDPKNFRKITYSNELNKVLSNIELFVKNGFDVKINTVLMKGVNDHEVFDFINFSSRLGVEVRFLELMRIGHACGEQNDQFINAREIIEKIKNMYEMKIIHKEKDSTSFNYLVGDSAQIGFIASESMPFCGNCSRWRISSDGILRACLLKNDGISVKNKTSEERTEIYYKLLGMKPNTRPSEVGHFMNQIGG